MITDEACSRLLAAIDAYDTGDGLIYDEVFREVQDRIASTGEADKIDIATLAFWKRSAQGAWISDLLRIPESTVRAATRSAFEATEDLIALQRLEVLPGYAAHGPLATALLTAYAPNTYAVLDDRALLALDRLGIPLSRKRGLTVRYFSRVRELRDGLTPRRPGVTTRDIDKGLFMIGLRPRKPSRTPVAEQPV